MKPINGYVLIEPITVRDKLAEDLSKIGLVAKEVGDGGTPNIGFVRYMDDKLDVEFKVGDKVVFNEPTPDGFRTEQGGFIPVKVNKIQAIIHES